MTQDDSPESELRALISPGTGAERDEEYDFTSSLEWLNQGYLTSTVAGRCSSLEWLN